MSNDPVNKQREAATPFRDGEPDSMGISKDSRPEHSPYASQVYAVYHAVPTCRSYPPTGQRKKKIPPYIMHFCNLMGYNVIKIVKISLSLEFRSKLDLF
jgi:hypothetical protein